jgi:hypothetical protein
MRWLSRLVLGVFLALSMVMTALAAGPDGLSPTTALPISTSISGSLTGSSVGSFSYATFNYAGDGSQGTISFTFSPTDPLTAKAVGVNLFQNGASLGTLSGVSPTPGNASLTFSSSVAGPVLVQVFNYAQDVPVSFGLSLAGVNQSMPAPAPTVAPTPAPSDSAANPLSLTGAPTVLPGNSSGSFDYYTLDYPGDGSTQSLTLNFAPNDQTIGHAVTVNVYQNGNLLATNDGSHAATPGNLVVSYSSSTPGPVLVQVGNYNFSTTITYTLSH